MLVLRMLFTKASTVDKLAIHFITARFENINNVLCQFLSVFKFDIKITFLQFMFVLLAIR